MGESRLEVLKASVGMREATSVLFAVLRRIENKLVDFEAKLDECHKLIEQLAVHGLTVSLNVAGAEGEESDGTGESDTGQNTTE